MTPSDSSVSKSVTVRCPVEHAWTVFTQRFDLWWPKNHKIGKADFATAIVEERDGGRWYQRGVDGSECEWGRVLVYRAPKKLVLAWHIDVSYSYDPDPAHASRVEVTFHDLGDGKTRVDMVHSELEKHGAGWQKLRESLARGWSAIFDGYAKVAAS
jgi:uncharacterized protein YndB with AHSA1/START domain